MVYSAFDVARSCYYVHRLRRRRVDARRVALRSQVNQLFSQSRGSAGITGSGYINSCMGYRLRWPKKNSTHYPG